MACSLPHTPSCSEERWDDKRLKMISSPVRTSLVMVLKTLRWSKSQPWSHNLWGLPSTRLITLCLRKRLRAEPNKKADSSSSPDGCELVWICVLHLEGGEVRGREVPKLCIDCPCVEHGAGTGVARLPWDPGKNFFPRSSCPSLLKVYHLVGATMGRRVEDEHLHVIDE